eukprot:1159435-Pelagomonas_calceolata.AAC.3
MYDLGAGSGCKIVLHCKRWMSCRSLLRHPSTPLLWDSFACFSHKYWLGSHMCLAQVMDALVQEADELLASGEVPEGPMAPAEEEDYLEDDQKSQAATGINNSGVCCLLV